MAQRVALLIDPSNPLRFDDSDDDEEGGGGKDASPVSVAVAASGDSVPSGKERKAKPWPGTESGKETSSQEGAGAAAGRRRGEEKGRGRKKEAKKREGKAGAKGKRSVGGQGVEVEGGRDEDSDELAEEDPDASAHLAGMGWEGMEGDVRREERSAGQTTSGLGPKGGGEGVGDGGSGEEKEEGGEEEEGEEDEDEDEDEEGEEGGEEGGGGREGGEYGSSGEESLDAYDLSDDRSDLRAFAAPRHLRQLLAGLRAKERASAPTLPPLYPPTHPRPITTTPQSAAPASANNSTFLKRGSDCSYTTRHGLPLTAPRRCRRENMSSSPLLSLPLRL